MSTLLEDVKRVVAENGNYAYGWLDDMDIEDVEVVENEDTGAYSRWANVMRAVWKRGDEYVAITYHEPATEMQEWDDWSADEVEVEAVKPVEVTIVRYQTV